MLINYLFNFIALSEEKKGRSLAHYQEAEAASHTFSRNYGYMMTATIFFLLMMPGVITGIYYARGTLTRDRTKMPVESMYVVRILH